MALCYSGGIRSEVIAFCLREEGIPFETYFLDIWGINGSVFRTRHQAFEREYGKSVRIVNLGRLEFYDTVAPPLFKEFGVDAPTYLALTYLFDRIPEDEFILVGDGDLQRQGRAYGRWGRPQFRPTDAGHCLPFLPSSIFYYQWSQKRSRSGEFYFYRSTPELVAAQIGHPEFSLEFPFAETTGIFSACFPEVEAREKSNNWSREAYQENVWVREWLGQCAREEKMDFWRDNMGVLVPLTGIFR